MRSSAPLLFPHRSLGGKKAGGHEGQSCSLKRKLAASAERRDSCHHSSDIPSVSAETHLPCLSAAVQGSPTRVTKTVRHFQQRQWNMLFYSGVIWRENHRIAAGNPWTSCCKQCGLLRIGESAEQSEVWIRCSFNGEGFESRRVKIL